MYDTLKAALVDKTKAENLLLKVENVSSICHVKFSKEFLKSSEVPTISFKIAMT